MADVLQRFVDPSKTTKAAYFILVCWIPHTDLPNCCVFFIFSDLSDSYTEMDASSSICISAGDVSGMYDKCNAVLSECDYGHCKAGPI